MIRRSTWVILGLFALSLAAFWYLQYRGEQQAAEATPTAAPQYVFSSTGDPVAIRLASADGLVLEMVNKGIDGWQIVDPELGAADAEQVYTLTSSLMGLKVVRTLDLSPTAADMGLVQPAYTLQLTWADQSVQVLEVGKTTPTRSGYYARLDGGTPMLIAISGLATVQDMLEMPPALPTATPEAAAEETPTVAP